TFGAPTRYRRIQAYWAVRGCGDVRGVLTKALVLGREQRGQLPGVGLGVVAVAVVEQHVCLLRLLRELLQPRRPRLELLLLVEVAEPVVDVVARPLVAVAVEAHDGEVRRRRRHDRRHRRPMSL